MQRVKKYTLTAHPQLFEKTYWGNHVMSPDKDQAIIHNRNAFVAQFGIRSYVDGDRRPAYVRAKIDRNNNRHMDHCEVYKDEQGDWVLLTSPCLPEEGIRHLEANGWQTKFHLSFLIARKMLRFLLGNAKTEQTPNNATAAPRPTFVYLDEELLCPIAHSKNSSWPCQRKGRQDVLQERREARRAVL
ncbi:hypothetical protein QOT17_024081 [Balamuthia mandrillaris]